MFKLIKVMSSLCVLLAKDKLKRQTAKIYELRKYMCTSVMKECRKCSFIMSALLTFLWISFVLLENGKALGFGICNFCLQNI